MLKATMFFVGLYFCNPSFANQACQGQRQAYIDGKVTQIVRVEGYQEPICLAFASQLTTLQNRMCPIDPEILQFGIPVDCATPLKSKLNGLVIINEATSTIQFKQYFYRYPELVTPHQPIPELGIQ